MLFTERRRRRENATEDRRRRRRGECMSIVTERVEKRITSPHHLPGTPSASRSPMLAILNPRPSVSTIAQQI